MRSAIDTQRRLSRRPTVCSSPPDVRAETRCVDGRLPEPDRMVRANFGAPRLPEARPIIPSKALAIATSRALTRPSRSRRACRRSSSEPMLPDRQSRHCVSPSPNHNICYSRHDFDATLLASQRQIRPVLFVLSYPLLLSTRCYARETIGVSSLLCIHDPHRLVNPSDDRRGDPFVN